MRTLAPSWRSPLIVFGAGLALYLPLLPSTVSFEDSGDFVSAAATMGIPHPSGYPLYVLLAGIIAKLPFGTVPWRVALFSALCSAAALAVAYVIARRLAVALMGKLERRHELFMGLVLLQLAVTETWWSQAVYTKVYPLHVLLMALITYALVRWVQERGRRWLSWGFFLFGLALSNHLFLTLSVAPFFVVALALSVDLRKLHRQRGEYIGEVSMLAGFLLLGLTPYFLLLLRPLLGPSYLFGHHQNFTDFLQTVFRTSYKDVGAGGWNKSGIVSSVLGQYARELGPLLLVLAIYGLWKLRRGRHGTIAIWLGGLVLSFPLIVLLRSIGWSPEVDYIYRVYALPGMYAVALAAAAGAPLLLRHAEERGKVAAAGLLLVCAAALPLVTGIATTSRVTAYTSDFTESYARALIEPLPLGAVLMVNDEGIVHDTEIFTLAYLQMVAHVRPDVTLITDVRVTPFEVPKLPEGYGNFALKYRRRMMVESVVLDPRYAHRPFFTTFAPEGTVPRLPSRTNGFTYGLAVSGEPVAPGPARVVIPSDDVVEDQFALRSLVTHLLYNQAARIMEQENNRAALPTLVRAISLDPYPASNDYEAFVAHRRSMMIR